jgi:EAL domain-containing protein (putative c-di-GMP-specific phosphodiesterase class I)
MRRRTNSRLELDLRRAIEREELTLFYQPDVALDTGRIAGVEALLRWRHPRQGMLGPLEFIPLAEESGLILSLGEWVIHEACGQAKAWQDAGHGLSVAINISPKQLADEHLPEVLGAALLSTGADPRLLCLEITESAPVDASTPMLAALRDLGVRLALDDFGAGFSSLNRIRSLPRVDTLKIDQTFTEALGHHPADAAIVGAIVSMARAMEMETVAEGVETERQAQLIRELGCDRAQGFHFCRPRAATHIDALLATGAMPVPGG